MSDESVTKQTVFWWEKTVEYKFIEDCLEKQIIKSIAPLDGFQEQAGDVITAIKNAYNKYQFYIIEFKKDLGMKGFNREVKDKFKGELEGYRAARECLTDIDNKPTFKGHYFIGAIYEKNIFQLVVRNYFAHDLTETLTLEKALESGTGMTEDQFAQYVGRFASHKKTNKCRHCSDSGEGDHDKKSGGNPDPGGEAIKVEDLSMVVAINPEDKKCIVFPLTLIHLTDGMGGATEIKTPSGLGGGGADGISINHAVIIRHTSYEDFEDKDQLSRPDTRQEEVMH